MPPRDVTTCPSTHLGKEKKILEWCCVILEKRQPNLNFVVVQWTIDDKRWWTVHSKRGTHYRWFVWERIGSGGCFCFILFRQKLPLSVSKEREDKKKKPLSVLYLCVCVYIVDAESERLCCWNTNLLLFGHTPEKEEKDTAPKRLPTGSRAYPNQGRRHFVSHILSKKPFRFAFSFSSSVTEAFFKKTRPGKVHCVESS